MAAILPVIFAACTAPPPPNPSVPGQLTRQLALQRLAAVVVTDRASLPDHAGAAWPHGRHLFAKRCMALHPDRLRPVEPPPGLELRPAGPGDLDAYACVDAIAFDEDDVGPTVQWTRPMLGADDFRLALALLDDDPVGVAYAVRASGGGGRAVGVSGRSRNRAYRAGSSMASPRVEWNRSGSRTR